MIGRIERAALWVASMVLVILAFAFPVLHGGPGFGWQIAIAVAGATALAVSRWWQPGLAATAGLLTASVSIALVETSFPLPTLAAAGVTGLAALEGIALLRMWLGTGATDWRCESTHVLAGVRRCVIGAVAAGSVTALGAIKLPSPGIIAAVGVLAAGAVIAVSSARST